MHVMSANADHPKMIHDEPVGGVDQASPAEPPFSLRKSAHDLRNALNVMRNAGYLLKRKLVAAGGEHVDLVDMIEESVKAAETIATEMMEHGIKSGEPPTSRSAPRSK